MLDKILGARQTPVSEPAVSWFLPTRSSAGVVLTEERSLQLSAVFAATKAISETVAMLPWRVYREDGDRRELQSGDRLDVVLHRRPNDDMTAFTFRELLMQCALLHGNGYAEIERNPVGEAVALHPIHPDVVRPTRERGVLEYQIMPEDGGAPMFIPSRQMFHLRGPTRDGIVGRSVISLARESWGVGLASDQFSASFLANGATPATVIQQGESAPKIGMEGIQNMLSSFDRRHKGAIKAGRTAFLERGYDITSIGIPQKDAQFIELRKFTVQEVARWFRIQPHKIGSMEDATYSNLEQQNTEYVTDTIQPWVERLEQEADIKLVRRPQYVTKININGLLRGDSAARSAFYNTLWNIGVYSVNDIRRMEDENPVNGGDKHFVPLNMATLDRAAQAGTTDGAGAMHYVLIDAHQRMLDKERAAAERAHGKGKDMVEWTQDFYSRQEPQMQAAIRPGVQALAEMYGVADIEGVIYTHCREHVEASMRDIAEARWQWDARAEKQADRLIQSIVSRSQSNG